MNHPDTAKTNAINGNNCCQSVFAAFCEELGLEKEKALKIAAGFGAGVCRGEICGAVTGALMALGLKKGTSEGHGEMVELVKKFTKIFEERHGSIRCRELLGCDISIEENYERVKAAGAFEKICRNLIADSAGLLDDFLKGE